LFVSNVPLTSINLTSSPTLGEAGKVAVIPALDVSTKYPFLEATLKAEVFDSHEKSASTVTLPPKATALPLIVIPLFAKAELGTEDNLALGKVPVVRLLALVVSTTANVLSPLRKVVLFLVPDAVSYTHL
tara:strand:- start:17 stop:406 length:390 start_codon:yes stop_codon:yes gene_type:complete